MKKILCMLVACCMALQIYAQNIVTGTVSDESGSPVIGASVKVKNGSSGTITDANGKFSLSLAPSEKVLVVSYLGYASKEVSINNRSTIKITLASNEQNLNEVIVVGYGQQRKATLTGSVSAVTSKEIATTKNQNLQNMLTGKVPGLRVIQRTSEPGTFDNKFDIRGFGDALMVVDGIPRSNSERIDPNEVESISILKDASAAVYGVRAANGVVLITTKKGAVGKPTIDYSFFTGIQNASGLPSPLGAIDRFTLFNEQSMHNVNSPTLAYSDAVIQPYLDGTKQSTDWYGMVMRKNAPQSQQNLSVSGSAGTQVDYFINMGYSYQGGFWESKDLNYNKYNFRSNLNAKITNRLTASLKASGILDQQNRPYRDSWEIFKNIWRSHPDDPYYANDNSQYLFKNLADYHPGAISNSDISGYRKNKNKIFQSSFSLDYKVPYIEGLNAKGLFSYDENTTDRTDYQKVFSVYDYNVSTSAYTPTNYQAPNQVTRNYGTSPSTLMQFSLNYKHNFNNKHFFDVLALYEEGKSKGDGFFAQRQLSIALPYLFAGNATNQVGNANSSSIYENATKGLVGRINYNYTGKYLADFSFRYDGSSKFPAGKQWGFFPATSIGWRISEESFFKNSSTLSFVDNLKLRGSYGVLGDDGASAYQFISGYDYPFSGGNSQALAAGYLFDNWTSSLGFRNVANENITWYTSKLLNLGIDADFWKGKLSVVAEVYRRNREGLLASRLLSLPGSFGANLPQENLNSDQTEGIELSLNHKNRIGNDFNFSVGGNISLTRTKLQYVERAQDGNSYLSWRNNPNDRYNDVWFGYGYVGQYQDYQQIKTYPVYTGRNVLPGDYIYEDWNNDGTIDDADRYPIATSSNPTADANGKRNYPLLNFGLNFSADFKGFDINALFQGAGKAYAAYGEMYQSINQNALDFFMDRWHLADPKKDPYDPSNIWIPGRMAYTGTDVDLNSERGIQNVSYLRLKSIEIGYTLKSKWVNKIGMRGLRVYANGYNLVTFTNAIGVDPEHPTDLFSYLYPLNKTVSIGAAVKF